MKKYSKDIYTREALMKAAFSFTDLWYIHLSVEENDYVVTILEKETLHEEEEAYCRFENELLMQENRRIISEKTGNIREMLVARALASTLVNRQSVKIEAEEDEFEAESVLVNWFGREK